MEMLLAWGVVPGPEGYEGLSWHTRQRMWRFWVWKHERERLLREEAEMKSRNR